MKKEKVNDEEKKEKKVESVKVDNVEKKDEKTKQVKKLKSKPSSDKVIIFIIVGVCVLIALLVFGFVFYKSNYESVVSTDYGVVNKAEYTVYYKMFAPMLEHYGYTVSQIPQVIANKAGTDKIILKKAAELGVKLSDEEKAEIDEVFSDKEQISTWQSSGINTVILRKLYEEDYIISSYIKKLAEDIKDEDMLEYLKDTYGDSADLYEYNTRHILIKTTVVDEDGNTRAMNDEEKNNALERANGLLERAKSGEDFETLAKENSEDGTKTEGGKFTFYDGDSVLDEYATAAKSLNEGEIYDTVVETSAGYHIIKLDSKVENGKINSENERNYYANEIVNNYSVVEKIDIKTDVLDKLVESITGTKVDESSQTDISLDSEEYEDYDEGSEVLDSTYEE